ncbi:hypothetical protein KKE06_00155 [Candidatus Micrarchaeota archaeon]|nr:hypothetical protein [Candidatus Micrarchaeota archaeon]MBU1930098.1 hypothetical protein [Candidatus Micrarchaeota archaeon]
MQFELLELGTCENTGSRSVIRAYTIVPNYVKNPTVKNIKAQKIVDILRQVNSKLKKKLGLDWKAHWLDSLPFEVKKTSTKDWFLGRASIPLIAISQLANFGCGKEVQQITNPVEYFCSTTGTVSKIPKTVSEEIAWLVAAILCDGHIKKNENRVVFFSNIDYFVKRFESIVCNLFEISGTCRISKTSDTGVLYEFAVENKPMAHFLNKFCEIPRGKKSHLIVVPRIIWEADFKTKKAFLKGVFDPDGGKRSSGLGLTSASKKFRDQVYMLLQEFDIVPAKDEWLNRKYNKRYYGLRFKITPKSSFLCRCAGAVKRTGFRRILN